MQACCACGGGGAGDPPLTCAAAGSSTCLAENGCMLAGGACVESPVSCDGTTTGACTCTQLTLSIAGVPVSFTLIPVTDPASCCLGFCSFLGVKADTAVPYHLSFRRGKYYATRVASFPACLPSSGELSFAGVYDIEEVQAACHAAPSDHSTPPVRPSEVPVDLGPPDAWANSAQCLTWASNGQCESDPGFMLVNCNHTCAKVGLGKRQYNARCPIPPNRTAALPPGVLHRTFDRAMTDFADLKPERISVDPPALFHSQSSRIEASFAAGCVSR